MNTKTKKQILRYAVYFFILIFLFALQTAPRLFEIQNIKPVLIIPFALSIAMFENEIVSAVYCCLAGMLWDLSSNCLFGFNAIIFLILGVTISLFVMHFLRTKLLNFLSFLALCMLIQGGLYYLFYYFIWKIPSSSIIMIRHILPTVAYTVIIGIPIFYLVKFLTSKLSEQVRM